MSRHQPVSAFERSAFHRSGSAGALRFNAAPTLANVQALAPAPVQGLGVRLDETAAHSVPAFQLFNPALILDGKSRRAPRGIEIPPGFLALAVAHGYSETVGTRDPVSVLSERLWSTVDAGPMVPTKALKLPDEWSDLFVVGLTPFTGVDVDALRRSIRFVY